MEEVKKMIRTVINGQSALKQELLEEIKKVDKKVDTLDSKVDTLDSKVNKGFKEINERLDKQGRSLAFLEDDVPTIKEFDKLEEKVTKLESRAIKN